MTARFRALRRPLASEGRAGSVHRRATARLSAMLSLLLLPLNTEAGAGATPYLIGGGALVILLAAMFALLAFGKGREHS